MQSNYKPIGDYIQLVDERNIELKIDILLGLSINKVFIPSVANIVGTNMRNYKIIRKNQFACSIMQVRRDKKMPVALLQEFEEAIISQAYPVFEVRNENELLPEYLLMWFSRAEFDREACFYAVGGVRGSLEWEDFCEMKLPVPDIEKQREIVAEYNTVKNRIALNKQLIQKLEETAQAIYKQWFVDFKFPDENGKPYKSSGGKMVWNEELGKEIPERWEVEKLKNKCSKIGSGSTPRGGKGSYENSGTALIRSLNVHDFNFVYKDLAFISDSQAKKLNNVQLKADDILLNITGVSVARCCMVPFKILPARVNQHVSIIRLENSKNEAYFLMCSLCSSEYKQKLLGTSESGSTRQAITKKEIEEFKILFPKKDILKRFNLNIRRLFIKKEFLIDEIQILEKLSFLLLAKITKVETEKEVV